MTQLLSDTTPNKGPSRAPSAGKGGNRGSGKGGARGNAGANGGRFANALYDPSQTLTGRPLNTAANAIADAQTKGPLSQLAAQIARNNQQGSAAQAKTFSYYMQLAQAARDSVGQQQQLATGLNSQLQGIGQNTQTQLSQYGQQATGGALGRMAGLGLDAGQTQALQAETARQQGIGALNAGAFQSAGAVQGANYTNNAASNLGTFALRGQERIGDIGRASALANAPLSDKQAALIASRGSLKATALGQLRAAERNYQIAQEGITGKAQAITAENKRNAATIAGENARAAQSVKAAGQRNAATIRAENSRNAATIAGADQRNSATIRAENTRNAAQIASRKSIALAKGRSHTPLTTHEQNTIYNEIDKLPNLIHSMQQPLNANQVKSLAGIGLTMSVGGRLSEKQIRSILTRTYAPQYVQAGYEIAGWGHITPKTAAFLHAAGLRGPHYRVGPPPPTPTSATGSGYASIPGAA